MVIDLKVKVPDQTIRLNRLNGFCHQEESDKKPLKNEIIIMTIAGMIMPDNRLYLPEYKRPWNPDAQSIFGLVRKTYKLWLYLFTVNKISFSKWFRFIGPGFESDQTHLFSPFPWDYEFKLWRKELAHIRRTYIISKALSSILTDNIFLFVFHAKCIIVFVKKSEI